MNRFLLSLCVIILPVWLAAGEAGDSFAHISYLEGEARIIRLDKQRDAVEVNLPVMPGDRLVTGDTGRCEVICPGGTLLRMGENSELHFESLSAQPYKHHGGITTLKLDSGMMYVTAFLSGDELFQVITPNAAVILARRSKSFVSMDSKKGTSTFVRKGMVKMIYQKDSHVFKRRILYGGTGGRVTRGKVFTLTNSTRKEFSRWNATLDKDSGKLHHGMEALPRHLDHYSRPVQRFIERWSTLYGEWRYDNWFGYIWKPFPKTFSRSQRPFPAGETRKINGILFFIPKVKWGWAPTHHGVWIWKIDSGWHWVPGPGFCANLTTLGEWIEKIYGSEKLYMVFRDRGKDTWQKNYSEQFCRYLAVPELSRAPEPVRQLVRKLNRIPIKILQDYSLFPIT